MDKIEKIRREIERLKDEYTDIAIDSHYGTVNANHVVADLERLLSFLDTLSEEPDKSLEEAANMMYPPGINDNLRNAFIAGAEWQKGQDNIISRQAEVEIIKTQQMCYEKGQADMKRQMMKEAVEGQIYGSDGSHWIETDIDKNIKGKEGDNVRIIVCKNEEE